MISALLSILAVGSFSETLAEIAGVLLGLAGLAVAFMGLIAMTEGAGKRGAGGLVFGLGLAALGCWMLGVFS